MKLVLLLFFHKHIRGDSTMRTVYVVQMMTEVHKDKQYSIIPKELSEKIECNTIKESIKAIKKLEATGIIKRPEFEISRYFTIDSPGVIKRRLKENRDCACEVGMLVYRGKKRRYSQKHIFYITQINQA